MIFQVVGRRGCVVSGKATVKVYFTYQRDMLTRTFSSGNPPSTFLSHIKTGLDLFGTDSQTRKRPVVSSWVNGIRDMEPMIGAGKVKNNSVWTQDARCNLYISWF